MKAQIVSFHCVLKNKLGQVLSSSFNQDVINQLETGGNDRLSGLAAGLQDVRQGEKRQVSVPAEEAYGLYDPNLVLELRRSDLTNSKSIKVGEEVARPHGRHGELKLFRVIKVTKGTVTLDANHPFAGLDLIFDIEVVSARDAMAEDFGPSDSSGENRVLH